MKSILGRVLRCCWLFLICGRRRRQRGLARVGQLFDMTVSVVVFSLLSCGVVAFAIHRLDVDGPQDASLALGVGALVTWIIWAYGRRRILEWESGRADYGGHAERHDDDEYGSEPFQTRDDAQHSPPWTPYEPPASDPFQSPPQPAPPEWESERYGRDYGP